VVWFVVGTAAAFLAAEVTARIAEAAGPPALRYYDATTQLKVEQMDRLGGVDVVFAGTSMAWQGLVPEVFTANDAAGRAAYNAALAGGVPVVMEPWLLEEVVPRLHPDLVIWGLSSMDFSAAYGEENLERYRDALEARIGWLAATEQAAADVSALVRYRTILRRPSALMGPGRHQIDHEFSEAAAVLGAGGERLDFVVDTGPERGRQVEARLRNYRIDPADIDAVERTASALRSRGIQVVLVELPFPSRYMALHPDGAADTTRAHETIAALADILELPFVDLRYGFRDDDFVDFTHLDRGAAARLTMALAGALADITGPAQPPTAGPETTLPGQSTVPPLTDPATPAIPAAETLLDTAGRAIRVYDRFHRRLFGSDDSLTAAAYWTSREHAGKHGDLAAGAGSNGFKVVMVGSSLVVNGFDPTLFAELDGRTAFNAGLPALTAEELAFWMPDVLRLANPSLVVYGLAPRDIRVLREVEGACVADVEDWSFAGEVRDGAFGPVDALAGVTWETLLYGQPVRVLADETYRRSFDEVGGRRTFPRSTTAEIEAAAKRGAWSGPFATCEPRFDSIAANVAALRERGVGVVVVFMPISGPRAAMFEGGRAEIEEVLSRISTAVTGAGADAVLDFSGLLPDTRFRDLAHADAEGSRIVTRELVAHLDTLGL